MALLKLVEKSYPPTLCPEFLTILIESFSLNVEGYANPLHHFSGFEHWCSPNPEDRIFGALGSYLDSDLSGKNSFVFPDHESLPQAILKTNTLIESPAPTRVLLLLPTATAAEHKFLVIAHISGCPIYSERELRSPDLSLVLALNKESMIYDPIDWALLSTRLKGWSELLRIPALTDSLFRERIPVNWDPRASCLNLFTRQMKQDAIGCFNFHRPLSSPVDRQQLRPCFPSSTTTTLTSINKHKFSFSVLGILPNQLRKLLRLVMGDCEPILDHLSKTFFWGGYNIWKARKRLAKQQWERLQNMQQKRKPKRKGDKNESACKNPFHYLLKASDLSRQRLTRCPCSKAETKPKFVETDLRAFMRKVGPDALDRKHTAPVSSLGGQEIDGLAQTRKADLIRVSHFHPP